MATAQDVIKNFARELDRSGSRGVPALNSAVKAVSNFSSWSELKDTIISDCASYHGDWSNFLKDMCGIILDNDDTGAISGSDAGGGSTKTAESIVPESGSWSYPSDTTFSTHGLTVTVPRRDSLSDSEQFIVGALYSWWIDSSLALIENSYGLSFNSSGASIKEIDVRFIDKDNGQMAYVEYTSGQKCTELHLVINMHYYDGIDQSDPNGSGNANALTYLDRTIAHEMVHAVMAANIDYFSSMPTMFREGSAELIHGIDDKRGGNIKNVSRSSSNLKNALEGSGADSYAAGYILLRYLAKQAAEDRDPSVAVNTSNNSSSSSSSTISSGSDNSSTSTNNSSTISSGSSNSTISSGSKNSSTSTNNSSTISSGSSTPTIESSATFSGKTLTVKGNFDKDIWLGGRNVITGKSNSAYANSETITINANQMTSSLILAGNSQNNSIISGSEGATLWGGAGGNDTLTGGDGQDVFWYSLGGGNDVIKKFTSGKDTNGDVLNISGGGISSMTRKNGTVNLVMSDEATLKVELGNTVDTAIKFATEWGNSNTKKLKIGNTESNNTFTYDENVQYYFGGTRNNTLTVEDGADIWLSRNNFSRITEVNAQKSSGNNILAGDSASNTLIGGSGSNSLWGGSGETDDLLKGGSGQNIFWYGKNEGDDKITDAKETDTLRLYNIRVSDITSIDKLSNGVKVNFSSGSLTIEGNIPTVRLASGSLWSYDSTNKKWSAASGS